MKEGRGSRVTVFHNTAAYIVMDLCNNTVLKVAFNDDRYKIRPCFTFYVTPSISFGFNNLKNTLLDTHIASGLTDNIIC